MTLDASKRQSNPLNSALRIDPAHAETHTNRGLTLLLQGELEQGWQEYGWRWRTRAADPIAARTRFLSLPLWQGEPGAGRAILLWYKQGLGDSIQFARYIPAVVARGWTVILEIPKQLVRLFDPLANAQVRIVAIGDPVPPADFQCPLAGLPQAFSTTIATIPSQVPYLEAEPALRSFWRQLLPAEGLRVGIVWQGSPEHKNDHNRSIPLKTLAPLTTIRDVHLISLQKEYGLEQLGDLPEKSRIQTLGKYFEIGGFPRHGSADHGIGLGCHRGYFGHAFGGSIGASCLGCASCHPGLALAAGSYRQPLVSQRQAVPPTQSRRLGWSYSEYGDGTGSLTQLNKLSSHWKVQT